MKNLLVAYRSEVGVFYVEYTNECPGYDTNQSNGEVPVIQEFWETLSTLSLPSLPGPL